jgi:hypothetical protein
MRGRHVSFVVGSKESKQQRALVSTNGSLETFSLRAIEAKGQRGQGRYLRQAMYSTVPSPYTMPYESTSYTVISYLTWKSFTGAD